MGNNCVNVNEWHGQLGHVSDNIMQHMTNYYGKWLQEKFEKCDDCVMGKAWQANMNKEQVERATEPGE